MGRRESGIQSAIVDAAVKLYGRQIVIRVKHGDPYAVVGDPDLYGCLDGCFFGFEVKNEEGQLSKIQLHRLREIRYARGLAEGVRSVEDALHHLDRIVAANDRPDLRR